MVGITLGVQRSQVQILSPLPNEARNSNEFRASVIFSRQTSRQFPGKRRRRDLDRFGLIWKLLTALLAGYLRFYMPANIAIDLLRIPWRLK